jgi:hypothetical protein
MTDLHHTSTNPETCHVCGRRAHGVATGPRGDRWLCAECLPLLEYVKDIRRWDAYEDHALAAVDEATSEYAAEHGTDIAEYSDVERRGLWRCAILAHQTEIRRLVRNGEAPF